MGGFKVAIMGAGSMGALLATRIPASYRKVIISGDRAEAAHVADEVGGVASDQVSAVRGCQVILLAVPGAQMPGLVREAMPHLLDGALVVNTAPDLATPDLAAEFPKLRFAAAKLIGHPTELSMGSPGVVVLDHVDDAGFDQLSALLEGLGPVVSGSEDLVAGAQEAMTGVMARARAELQDKLSALGLEEDLARTAVTATAPGVLRDLAGPT